MKDFIRVNADLHLHGLYSGGVSSSMVPDVIGQQAPLKGLQLVGTGDILNPSWAALVREQLRQTGDLLEHPNGTKFVLQTEVEDINRVHHVILFPDWSKVDEVAAQLAKHGKLEADGRPKLRLDGEQLAEICTSADCLIGFAHAFTPYFGLYSKYNSYKDCYGTLWKKISFVELGLSADTNMADRISELHELTFLSNSDAHSPWPNKLGREFNTFELADLTFGELARALRRQGGRRAVLNVGFNPAEGKYHKSRCRGCLTFFDPRQAAALSWTCPYCGKPIKKGVDWRIEELADLPAGVHPEHRPPYRHIIPLNEIIALSLGIKNPWSSKVQSAWKKFVHAFGSEINVLLNAELDELARLNKRIAEFISYFREGKIEYEPGGGGVYGKLLPPGTKPKTKVQRNLLEY